MYITILTLAALASSALAAPGAFLTHPVTLDIKLTTTGSQGQAEPETTVTAYKTITSCSGAAPACTASASEHVATVYSTQVYTITSCAPTVSSCPARSTSIHTSIVPIVSHAASVTASASGTPAQSPLSATISSTPVVASPASSPESTSYVTNVNTVTSCPGGKASTCPTSSVPFVSAFAGSAPVSVVVSSGVPSPSGNGTIVTQAPVTTSVTPFLGAGTLLSFNPMLVVVVGILGALLTL